MPPDTKLYDILEVEPTASEALIKRAYRRLARMHHPDKNPGQSDEMFKKLNFAHSVLTDPRKREVYDRHGLQGLRDGMGSGLFTDENENFEAGAEGGAGGGQYSYNVEEMLTKLLSEVFSNFELQITQTGVQNFARGATRCAVAYQRRDWITVITEAARLGMTVYNAWPTRGLPQPEHDHDEI